MSRIYNPKFDFNCISDDEITTVLREHSINLTVSEAKTIQSLLQRPPTLAECVLWSIQGSEHCSYKSSALHLQKLPTKAPNVILGPKEDAGIVEVARDNAGHRYGVVMSHESHNHPSQVVPFEGAATAIGGNVRDVSCMGAEVFALADVLCFGDINDPRTHTIDKGVVAGIASYGNAIGVPNIAGEVFYDPAYQDNCLVTAVALGCVREDQIIHSYAPDNAYGYELILVGKSTDNSGFGGASFASLQLKEEDIEVNKGAVQEPNAFLGCHMLHANSALFKKLADKGLLQQVGFKDLGAGGIACASVEIADGAHYGAEVYLEKVPTTMPHLAPHVILCSETQERYLWVVPPDVVNIILEHYNSEWQLPLMSRGAQATVIGKIRQDDQYVASYHGDILVSAKASDITKGLRYDRPHEPRKNTASHETSNPTQPLKEQITTLLEQENLVSKQAIYESYDKQVQGRTLLERGDASAGVMTPFNSEDYPEEIRNTAVALALAHKPNYGKKDAYWTGFHAVISSMRKVVAVGAKPAAISDCLCFGNPEKPEQMHDMVQAIAGVADACCAIALYDFRDSPTPVISGNVSLYNESATRAIPASPIVSCLGVLEDASFLVTPHFKKAGTTLIVIGEFSNESIPHPDGAMLCREFFAILDLARQHALLSCAVVEEGGLALALMAMSFANNLGFKLLPEYETDLLFNESGGFVIEVETSTAQDIMHFLECSGVNFFAIGTTIVESILIFNEQTELDLAKTKHMYFNRLREMRS